MHVTFAWLPVLGRGWSIMIQIWAHWNAKIDISATPPYSNLGMGSNLWLGKKRIGWDWKWHFVCESMGSLYNMDCNASEDNTRQKNSSYLWKFEQDSRSGTIVWSPLQQMLEIIYCWTMLVGGQLTHRPCHSDDHPFSSASLNDPQPLFIFVS